MIQRLGYAGGWKEAQRMGVNRKMASWRQGKCVVLRSKVVVADKAGVSSDSICKDGRIRFG
jgi:hypothetical protein